MATGETRRPFRAPNVCITAAEVEWLKAAAAILNDEMPDASVRLKRKAAAYVMKAARDAARDAARAHGPQPRRRAPKAS